MTSPAAAERSATSGHGRHDPQWRFDGRTAVVTGGSRGIGLAIASLLAAGGAEVIITGRSREALDAAVADIDGQVSAVSGAVDAPAHAEEVMTQALARHGRVDYLVNNAATNPAVGPLHEADLDAFDKTWMVNLRAPLVMVQQAWRMWMAAHGGAICNVASLGGLHPQPGLGSYNVSKAALLHMTRQLALDMAPTVRVNAVAPAVVRTDFARPLYGDGRDPTGRYPVGRLGEPRDVANAVAYLLSDAASWITGATVVLDGGVSLRSEATDTPYATA